MSKGDWFSRVFEGLLEIGKLAVEEEMKNMGVDLKAPAKAAPKAAEEQSSDNETLENLDVIETTGETVDEEPKPKAG